MELSLENKLQHKREWWIAALLSFFLPGLGQIYNGQLLKGGIHIVITHILILCLFEFNVIVSFYSFIIFVFTLLFFCVYSFTDAILVADRRKVYQLKMYNKLYIYIIISIFTITFRLYYLVPINRSIELYSIPTAGNSPSVEVGDYVLCNNNAYNNKTPDYGDITTFTAPNKQTWFFRIVGLPNDIININKNKLTINGKVCDYEVVDKKTLSNDYMPAYHVTEFKETLPNGVAHNIYMNDEFYDSSKTNIKSIKVPENEYFLMGDNRDNALDSRYIGSIKKENIRGKIMFCYFSLNGKRIGINF